MDEYGLKHVSFNPSWSSSWGFPSPLQRICDAVERDGWELIRLVPHHQYETVAVFMKTAEEGS